MDKLEKSIIEIVEQQKHVIKTVDSIHSLLYGNGSPERGFVSRLIRVERVLAIVTKISWLLVSGIVVYGFTLL